MPTLVFKPLNKKNDEASLDQLRTEVDEITYLFDGISFKAYLVGGVGLAIRNGGFYRNHRDLDLAVFTEDFLLFAEHLYTNGYVLVNRHLSANVSPWHNMQAISPLKLGRIYKEDPASLRIRAIKKGKSGFRIINERANYFDVFFLGRREEGVKLYGYDVVVPWEDFLPEKAITSKSGLYLPNINYKCYLNPEGPKQQEDFIHAGIIPQLPIPLLNGVHIADI